MPQVNFLPSGGSGPARIGESVLDVALRLGIPLGHACGGRASCPTCRVLVVEGAERLSRGETRESQRLPDERLEAGWRLACQARLRGDVTVRIPTLVERVREARSWPEG